MLKKSKIRKGGVAVEIPVEAKFFRPKAKVAPEIKTVEYDPLQTTDPLRGKNEDEIAWNNFFSNVEEAPKPTKAPFRDVDEAAWEDYFFPKTPKTSTDINNDKLQQRMAALNKKNQTKNIIYEIEMSDPAVEKPLGMIDEIMADYEPPRKPIKNPLKNTQETLFIQNPETIYDTPLVNNLIEDFGSRQPKNKKFDLAKTKATPDEMLIDKYVDWTQQVNREPSIFAKPNKTEQVEMSTIPDLEWEPEFPIIPKPKKGEFVDQPAWDYYIPKANKYSTPASEFANEPLFNDYFKDFKGTRERTFTYPSASTAKSFPIEDYIKKNTKLPKYTIPEMTIMETRPPKNSQIAKRVDSARKRKKLSDQLARHRDTTRSSNDKPVRKRKMVLISTNKNDDKR